MHTELTFSTQSADVLRMNVRESIEDLRRVVADCRDEDTALAIGERVQALRQCYRKNPRAFSGEDIGFLRVAAALPDRVAEFAELQGLLIGVDSLDESEEMAARLLALQPGVAGTPIVREVAREIRRLEQVRAAL